MPILPRTAAFLLMVFYQMMAATQCACPTFQSFPDMELCLTTGTWTQAQANCATHNSTLATMYSYAEYQTVWNNMKPAGYTTGSPIYIGYSDEAAEWTWMPENPGAIPCFERFGPGEANGIGGPLNRGENCMSFYYTDGTTVDITCTAAPNLGICQRRHTIPPAIVNLTLADCPLQMKPAGRFCYKYLGEAVHNVATCPSGSQMLELKCSYDHDTFVSQFLSTEPSINYALLSLSSDGTANRFNWRWQPSNEYLIYHRWADSETGPGGAGRCVGIRKVETPPNHWNSNPCTSSGSLVCQLSPSSNICYVQSNYTTMLTNGYFINQITFAPPSSSITYQCNATACLRTTGTQSVTYNCLSNRTWDKPLEACEQTCSISSFHSSVVCNNCTGIAGCSGNYLIDQVVTFSCADSSTFVIDGSPTSATCLTTGTWNNSIPAIHCTNTCNVPSASSTLIASYTSASNGRVLENGTMTFTCSSTDYFLNGSATLTCQSNGSWTDIFPTCVGKCQPVNASALAPHVQVIAYSDSINYQVGSTVAFNCNPNTSYVLVGASVSICDSPNWHDPLPTCDPTCPIPVITAPLIFAGTGTGPLGTFLIDSTITFSCNQSNMVLVGAAVARCLGNGTWDALPQCVGQCPTYSEPQDGSVSYTDSRRLENSTLEFVCESGEDPTGATSAVCQADHTWSLNEPGEPTCKKKPEDPVIYAARMVIQTLGCLFLIGAASAAVGVCILLRDFSVETILHLCEDIAIIVGHVLILTVRERTESFAVCTTVAVSLQYIFLVLFTFLFFEAIHSYTILTNVVSQGAIIERKLFLAAGWGIPFIYSVIFGAAYAYEYAYEHACWLNWGSLSVTCLSVVPIVCLSLLTIICTEAASMFRREALPDCNRSQLLAARINQNAMWFLLIGHWFSWFLGNYAVYFVHFAWYSSVFVANVSLGVFIFVFHVMGSPKANQLVKNLLHKYCCKKQDKLYASNERISANQTIGNGKLPQRPTMERASKYYSDPTALNQSQASSHLLQVL